LRDLRRQIHTGLELVLNKFKISISARINTNPTGSGGFYSLFRVISEEIWGMIKITAPYQIYGYRTLELVFKFEPIFNSDYNDPTNIPESSILVMAEERTHSRAQEQPPSRITV
jgi:hypothetical protein